MATTYSALFGLDLAFHELITGTGIQDGPGRGGHIREQLRLTVGVDIGKINIGYAKTETGVAASSSIPYALEAGGLKDTEGNALVFGVVTAIAVRNNRPIADTGAYIEWGPNSSNGIAVHADGAVKALTDRVRVPVGSGWVGWYSPTGWPISAALDELAIDTSSVAGDTNGWDLIVLGRV